MFPGEEGLSSASPAHGCVEWSLLPGLRHLPHFRSIETPTGLVTPEQGSLGRDSFSVMIGLL